MKCAATSNGFSGLRGWLGTALLGIAFVGRPALAVRRASDEGNFSAAVALLDAKEYPQAELLLQSLVRREPFNGLYWFNLGSARYNQSKIDGASQAFEKVITLQSPLTPAARLSLAKCRRRQGEFVRALAQLRKIQESEGLEVAVAGELKTLRSAALEAAMEKYESHEFEPALSGFEVASEIEADSEVAFMLGLTLIRLERPAEAKPALRRAESLSRGGPARDQSRYFLEKIDRVADSPGWLFVEVALGYNTNVFLEGKSLIPTAKAATQTLLGAGISLFRNRRFTVDMNYLLYWEEALGESAARFLSQTLRSDFTLITEPWKLRVFPALQHQIYGSDPFLLKASLGALLQRSIGNRLYGALQYEAGKNFGQLSEYQYLDGSTHALRGSLGYSKAAVDLSVYYSYLVDGTSDLVGATTTLPLQSTSHGPGVRLAWEPAEKWELSASVTYLWRNYANLAQPGGLTRTDGQGSGSLRGTYRWRPSVQFFGSLNALVNASTLDAASAIDDKNYTQVIALTGVTWDILN